MTKLRSGFGNHNNVATMLDLALGEGGSFLGKDVAEKIESVEELSGLQQQVVFILADIMDVPDEERIFYSSPSHWHLPRLPKDLKALLKGERIRAKRSWWETFFK